MRRACLLAQLACDGGLVVKLPDFDFGADRKAAAIERNPHGSVEVAEMRVGDIAVRPNDDQLTRLVG